MNKNVKKFTFIFLALIYLFLVCMGLLFFDVAGFKCLSCVIALGFVWSLLLSRSAFDVKVDGDIISFDTMFGAVEIEIGRIRIGAGCVPFGFMILRTPGYVEGDLYTVGCGRYKAVWVSRNDMDKDVFELMMNASDERVQ